MTAIYKFPLPYAPSLNVIMREHYHAKRKRVDAVMWSVIEQGRQVFPGTVKVTFTRYAIKLMDWDNCAASAKFILDGLVKAAVIKEDSPEVIVSFTPMQNKVSERKQERVEVIIESA